MNFSDYLWMVPFLLVPAIILIGISVLIRWIIRILSEEHRSSFIQNVFFSCVAGILLFIYEIFFSRDHDENFTSYGLPVIWWITIAVIFYLAYQGARKLLVKIGVMQQIYPYKALVLPKIDLRKAISLMSRQELEDEWGDSNFEELKNWARTPNKRAALYVLDRTTDCGGGKIVKDKFTYFISLAHAEYEGWNLENLINDHSDLPQISENEGGKWYEVV